MTPDYPNPLSVVPNLINELQARSQMEVLLDESIDEKMYRRTGICFGYSRNDRNRIIRITL